MKRADDATKWYRFGQVVARRGVGALVKSTFEGVENVPLTGPCILVPNHQSVLDPMLLQAGIRRPVDSMTKSTQFSSWIFRWILPRIGAFPVRRYRVDAQSVRVAMRRLGEGRAVCVYPEGERSWDGRLQPLRAGTLRLILRAGVPVIPVGIDGTYRTWPRWARRPRRGFHAYVRFGKPIHFGEYRDRREREAALPETDRILRAALLELSGEAARIAAAAQAVTPPPRTTAAEDADPEAAATAPASTPPKPADRER